MSAALAGGIIAGLGAVAGAGINAASSASNTNWALSESAAENQKQRTWAEQQAAQANQWNMQNWREQFGAQSEQAMKMFDTYNAYNKPSAVVQRLRDAGFNPAAYFQSGTNQGMSNYANLSAPSSSPAPAGIPSAGMQAFNVQPSTLNFTEAFEGISRAYENFMSAREKSSNAQRMTALLGAEQKLMIEKANNAELLNAFQQMENWYTKTNLPNRVERAVQETLEISSKVAFNKSATEYNQSKTLTEAFNRLNAEMDYSLKGEELTQAKTLSRYYEAQLLAHIEATRASAESSRASAALSSAQAETENVMRPLRSVGQSLLNDINENERNFQTASFGKRLEQLTHDIDRQVLDNHLRELKSTDMDAYNSFQRVLYGKGSTDDVRKFLRWVSQGSPLENTYE